MFGYIKPYKPNLRLKDITKYSNFYCALCDQLKKDYGFASRFILNYDITFLLLLLNHFDDNETKNRKFRCPYNLFKIKKVRLSAGALQYSAFINYWLVTEKLLDDYNDDNSFLKAILRKILISKRNFKIRQYTYEDKVKKLSSLLHQVYQSETNITNSLEFDRLTNSFGEFFAEIFFVDNITFHKEDLFRKLLFQIGKWIYIIDAYDDFEKDKKKNRFNLLYSLSENDKMEKEEAFEKTFSIHLQLKHKIDTLLHDLEDVLNDECLLNILTYGLDNVFYRITENKYNDYLGRLTENGTKVLE